MIHPLHSVAWHREEAEGQARSYLHAAAAYAAPGPEHNEDAAAVMESCAKDYTTLADHLTRLEQVDREGDGDSGMCDSLRDILGLSEAADAQTILDQVQRLTDQ